MAVTNFRASDFPKGKRKKEGKSEEREDNKVLDSEVKNAVRDPNEGKKVAKESEKKVAEAEETLEEEISHTETPVEDQEVPKPKAKTTRRSTKKSD